MNLHSLYETMNEVENLLKKDCVFQKILEHMCDVIMVWNAKGQIVYVSSQYPNLAFPEQTHAFFSSVHKSYRNDLINTFRKIKRTRKVRTVHYEYQNSDGKWLWFESIGIPFLNELGKTKYVIVTSKNITKQKQIEENLRSMAFYDPLTGLPNRRLFQEHFGQAITYAKRNKQLVALLYLDIDDFKLINDGMGHEIGDIFLKNFAKKIKSCIREIDTFARIGGDEFTIILPIVESMGNVEKVVNRIYATLAAQWEIEDHSFVATVSMGISVYPSDGDGTETLYRHADRALYKAKSLGRNHYRFYADD